MTAEEHTQFLQDADALTSGTIDDTSAMDESTDADNVEETESYDDETETGEEETEVKNESKTEKKIKKLLSKKNQAEKENETLREKVERLERESDTNKFHSEHPDAREHSDKIDALLEEKPWFNREDAYFFLQGRWEIQSKAWSNRFTGRPSTGLSTPKDPTKGSTADMWNFLKDNFNSWGFNWLL